MSETVTLYRPTGQREYELIAASDFTRFPPRLPEQPFFYPVANEAYATQIARDWNVKDPASTSCAFGLPRSFSRATRCVQQARRCTRSFGFPRKNWMSSTAALTA